MPKAIRVFFRIVSIFILLILTLILGGTALGMYFNNAPGTPPRIGEDTKNMVMEDGFLILEVKNGESGISVGKRLAEAGIIRNTYLWALLSRIDREFIKAGVYALKLPATQLEIRSLLVSGKQMLIKLTVPEGGTLKKTAQLLGESAICSAEDFLNAARDETVLAKYGIPNKTMEGYLYPDTYFFPRSYPAGKVVEKMADTFFEKLLEIAPQSLSMNHGELNKRIILASIVEREYRVADEAPLMAGVFFNRLNIGMALQSCATVEYVITEIQGREHPEVLYNRDIEIKDPYNTYIRPGLPPGPISAPGEVALKAVFEPAPSNYLYFRLADTASGKHYFSRTLDDHIRAGVLYVKRSSQSR